MRRILLLSIASTSALIALLVLTIIVFTACNGPLYDKSLLESKEGVHFTASSIADVKALINAEGKPVFILVHASYCAVCKKMLTTVFPQKEVGDYFNKKFNNVQVDIESEEGKRIVKEYAISGTPTLLFLAPDGKVISKTIGFHSKEELIALTKVLTVEGKPVPE